MAEINRKEWPMQSYMKVWQVFRQMSDENRIIAEHVLSRPTWPPQKNLNILDIGCGDGLLLKNVAHLCNNSVNSIQLLDPDKEYLDIAYKNITSTGILKVDKHLAKCDDTIDTYMTKVDVVLAVHMVYLLEENALETLISKLPKGVPLFIIFDTEGSFFHNIWEKTAPKYHQRVIDAHKIIQTNKQQNCVITSSSITTHLDDPLNCRTEIKAAVLSLLCYSNYVNLPSETQIWVENLIKDRLISNKLICDSTCYTIVKN